jgi:hypothetical protein
VSPSRRRGPSFNTGASAQVADNRTSHARCYTRSDGKDSEIFDLVKTRPGHWMGALSQDTWERERQGPVRFSLECQIDGEQPWQVSYHVAVG